ncbi:gamma-glutamylcyclotransferase family protein [Croceicoccus mobilis]|nr:gamma-glutamylcyclotransferase family protein [Croceicoccus mobilis]
MGRPGLVFVYGTLLAGSGTPANLWLEQRSAALGAASVPGRMIAIPTRLGWYPALLPARNPRQRVHGMLMRLDFRPGDWRWLDHYEGVEYRLSRIWAAGRAVHAYRWAAAIPKGAMPIKQGDFLRWLGETGRQPYCEPPPRHQARSRPFDRA